MRFFALSLTTSLKIPEFSHSLGPRPHRKVRRDDAKSRSERLGANMTDAVDLNFLARQFDRIFDEMNSMRDEIRKLSAAVARLVFRC